MGDASEVIIVETASFTSGIGDDDKAYKNPFTGLEEDKEDVENNETILDNC